MFIRYYSLALLLLVDCVELLCLWARAGGSVAGGTLWFDPAADTPQTAALFTGFVCACAASHAAVAVQPLSQYLLLLNAALELMRVTLCGALFSYNSIAIPPCTIVLTLFGISTCVYGRYWYSTRQYLAGLAK